MSNSSMAKGALWAGAGLVLALLVPTARARADGAPAARPQTLQVAVLRFAPRAEDPAHDWLGSALGTLLSGALAGKPGVVVVEREGVAELLRERDLASTGLLRPEDASKVARVADADWAVFGTFAASGDDVDVDLAVVDAHAGTPLRSRRLHGTIPELGRLVADMTQAVFGAEGLEPAVLLPPVSVEAMAAYYRALAAEDDADYPRAFVALTHALQAEPSFTDAALALGRLYQDLGQDEHAVLAWETLVRTSRDPNAVVRAARLAADAVEGEPRRADGAEEIVARAIERFPYHPEIPALVGRLALDLARKGRWSDALAFVYARWKLCQARDVHFKPDLARSASVERMKALWSTHAWEELHGVAAGLGGLYAALYARAIRAVDPTTPVPPGCVVLSASAPRCALSVDPAPQPGGPSLAAGLQILAARGLRISRLDWHVGAHPGGDASSGTLLLSGWGGGDVLQHVVTEITVPAGDAEPVDRAMRFSPPVAQVWVSAEPRGVRLDSIETRAELVPEGAHAHTGPAASIAGAAPLAPELGRPIEHLRVATGPQGSVHVVLAAARDRWWGEPDDPPAHLDPWVDPDLWIVSSSDGGRTFGAPRRLSVSSSAYDDHPALGRMADGRWLLAWISNRGNPTWACLYASTSDDLVEWSWPRRIAFPIRGHDAERTYLGPGAGTQVFLAEGDVQILEGDLGESRVILRSAQGPDGAGIYEIDTSDGMTWSAPRLLVGEDARGTAVAFPDGAVLVASRAMGREIRMTRWPRAGAPRELAVSGTAGVLSRYLWGPVLGRAPDGTLVLWDRTADGAFGLYTSRDGAAWTGPHFTEAESMPKDVWVGPDGTVQTLVTTSWGTGTWVLTTEIPR